MKSYYQDSAVTIYHGDCRDILPLLEPVDLVLTDPPYGIDFTQRTTGVKIVGDDKPFEPSLLWGYGTKYILWGADNYFEKLTGGSWLVWLKRAVEVAAPKTYADAELAWFSEKKPVRVIRNISDGCIREGAEHGIVRLHPSQKPIAVMRWCIQQAGDANTILDPFMGSGTTLRAAKDLGRKAIGIEIEEKYCEIAAKRMSQMVMHLQEV